MNLGSVLLVEDNRPLARLLTLRLEPCCHTFYHASTLAEARAALETESWDIILSDYHLPDGTGEQLFDILVTMPGWQGKFVLMSAGHRPSRGDISFLPKPFPPENLVPLLRCLMG